MRCKINSNRCNRRNSNRCNRRGRRQNSKTKQGRRRRSWSFAGTMPTTSATRVTGACSHTLWMLPDLRGPPRDSLCAGFGYKDCARMILYVNSCILYVQTLQQQAQALQQQAQPMLLDIIVVRSIEQNDGGTCTQSRMNCIMRCIGCGEEVCCKASWSDVSGDSDSRGDVLSLGVGWEATSWLVQGV